MNQTGCGETHPVYFCGIYGAEVSSLLTIYSLLFRSDACDRS